MRKTEETKDLSHPLTQKALVKTFNKCKFSVENPDLWTWVPVTGFYTNVLRNNSIYFSNGFMLRIQFHLQT